MFEKENGLNVTFQVVDPWGKIIAECDEDVSSVPQCRTVQISLDPMNNVRNRLPCFEHRRDDIYALAPIRMIGAQESVSDTSFQFNPVPIKDETTPYFTFEKYPVPESTTFLETPLSIAFTNVTCVVPGRKSFFICINDYMELILNHTSCISFKLYIADVLVATRRCVRRLKDLKPEEIVDFFMTVCKCQRLLEEHYQTTSSTVTVQDGEFAGQTVKVNSFASNFMVYIKLLRNSNLLSTITKCYSASSLPCDAETTRRF